MSGHLRVRKCICIMLMFIMAFSGMCFLERKADSISVCANNQNVTCQLREVEQSYELERPCTNAALGIPSMRAYVEETTRTSEASTDIRVFMPVLFVCLPEICLFRGWEKITQLHIKEHSSESIISYIHHQDGSKG